MSMSGVSLPNNQNQSSSIFSVAHWRERFLKLVLYGACGFGFIAALASIIDMLNIGQVALAIVYAGAWLGLVGITLGRLAYKLRAGAFLLLLYLIGLSGLLENGMRGDARLFFFAFVTMTALMFSPRVGIYSLVLSHFSILAVAVLVFGGQIHLMSKVTPAGEPMLWMVGSLSLLMMETIILTGLYLFMNEFASAQARVRTALDDLTRERALLRTLIDNLPDAVYAKDLQGRKTLVNRTYLDLQGLQSEEEVLGRTDLEIAGAGVLHFADQEIIQTGQPLVNCEEFIASEPAGGRWLLTSKVPLRAADGDIVGMMGISRDITDRRLAEEAQRRSSEELADAYEATLQGWSNALELRERETAGHSRRVVRLTGDLARALGIEMEELIHIRRGALLHDIGKMGVPDGILLKPGPLNEAEWEIMRQHPGAAYRLLSRVAFLRPSLAIPYSHHERWDGTGYPQGLKGTEIPLAARIFAVVDVWDALTHDRPYHAAWPREKVVEYLREQANKQFDPQVVEVLLEQVLAPVSAPPEPGG